MLAFWLIGALLAPDAWTARLSPVGDTVARVPRLESWIAATGRLFEAAQADPATRDEATALRGRLRGPFPFDVFDAPAWQQRGVQIEGPLWTANQGFRPVAWVVAATPGTAARLAPEGPVLRVGAREARRIGELLVADHEGHLVAAVDAPTFERVLGPPSPAPPEAVCGPSDGALLVLLGAAPGRRVSDGVEGCTILRAAPGRFDAHTRLRGMSASGLVVLLERDLGAPVLSPDGAVAAIRLRLAPTAFGLVKLRLLSAGLHTQPAVRALADQFDGRVEIVLRPEGELRAALGLRDALAAHGALHGASVPAAVFGDDVPAPWRGPLVVQVQGAHALLAPAGAAGLPAPASPFPTLTFRPALMPPDVLTALTGPPAAALLRRVDRVVLQLEPGEVLDARLTISGY